MIARVLGALGAMALAATIGFVTPPLAADASLPAAPPAQAAFNMPQAVQQAFAAALPNRGMRFALDSAQSSPVDGGGQRFEGSGIATFGAGDAQFVAFTLTLSARGERVAFDHSLAAHAGEADQMAAY